MGRREGEREREEEREAMSFSLPKSVLNNRI